jgi:two-component system chemotaxis response regulator CheY
MDRRAAGSASSCSVLVVEDDQDIRETIRDLLLDEGFPVQTAENGLDGLEVLASGERPCLVLLDMMMPVLDGAGFMARLRELAIVPGLPVVIVSAVATHHVPDSVGFLRKPIDLNNLLNTVREYCG